MNKIFYITKENDELLKKYKASGESMSGLVNELLAVYFGDNDTEPVNIGAPDYGDMQKEVGKVFSASGERVGSEINGEFIPTIPDIKAEVYPTTEKFVPRPPDPEKGYPCCEKATPCKHWQWDSSAAAWVNTLTGKTKEG